MIESEKEFDTVHHPIMIKTLSTLGIEVWQTVLLKNGHSHTASLHAVPELAGLYDCLVKYNTVEMLLGDFWG